MLSRIVLSLIVGLVAFGVTFLVGLVITLVPGIAPVGVFIQAVSPIVGVIAGLWYFFTGQRTIV